MAKIHLTDILAFQNAHDAPHIPDRTGVHVCNRCLNRKRDLIRAQLFGQKLFNHLNFSHFPLGQIQPASLFICAGTFLALAGHFAKNRHDFGFVDAVIIAAFGDPGLVAARELFDLPIVGMAEAAVLSACLLGERFSVVTFSPHMARWYTDCVRQTGLEARFTGVRCPVDPPASLGNVKTALRADLIALAGLATGTDGADVVILGGAPLAGLAPQIAAETPGILVDPIAAATVQAMAMARLAPSYRNRTARPAAKSSIGLGTDLAAVIAGATP